MTVYCDRASKDDDIPIVSGNVGELESCPSVAYFPAKQLLPQPLSQRWVFLLREHGGRAESVFANLRESPVLYERDGIVLVRYSANSLQRLHNKYV